MIIKYCFIFLNNENTIKNNIILHSLFLTNSDMHNVIQLSGNIARQKPQKGWKPWPFGEFCQEVSCCWPDKGLHEGTTAIFVWCLWSDIQQQVQQDINGSRSCLCCTNCLCHPSHYSHRWPWIPYCSSRCWYSINFNNTPNSHTQGSLIIIWTIGST